MKITLVGTGRLSIPPEGYGGIEQGIWNRRNAFLKEGHAVSIVNVKDGGNSILRRWKIIRQINASLPDVVHIHTSKYFGLSRFIRCPNILFSDHSPDVSFKEYKHHSRANIKGAHVMCLSEKIKNLYIAAGLNPDYLHTIPNEVVVGDFAFTLQPKYPDKSCCLGAVCKRKRQHAISDIPGIDFVGHIEDAVNFVDDTYKGEWSREEVCGNLTNYASMVLLSEAEAHNRACLEAMAAGLGLVISEAVADNLDTTKPFIDVVPEDRIDNSEHVAGIIAKNRAISLVMREAIRDYARNNFDTECVVKTKYLPLLKSITSGETNNHVYRQH